MKQKGLSSILAITIIALVGGLILILIFTMAGGTANNVQQTTVPAGTQTSQIQNSKDLDAAATDLDSTNVDSGDNQLNQINQDASTF